MKKYRNFKCSECELIEEKRVDDSVLIGECECGGLTKRIVSAPGYFGNTTGRSPVAARAKQP
tara:strand:+ start:300 stop:485 length:186 start_codon:yes stop_codon:yes gene_type:complete